MHNTALSAATIPDIYSADRGTSSASLLQIFFHHMSPFQNFHLPG
jgi:hypothetical protein